MKKTVKMMLLFPASYCMLHEKHTLCQLGTLSVDLHCDLQTSNFVSMETNFIAIAIRWHRLIRFLQKKLNVNLKMQFARVLTV